MVYIYVFYKYGGGYPYLHARILGKHIYRYRHNNLITDWYST